MGTKRVGWARIKSLINENQNYLQHIRPGYVSVTADATLTSSDSGKVILVGPAAAGVASNTTITLPTAAEGLWFRFTYMGGAADAHWVKIATGSDTNYYIGGIVQHDPDNGGDDTVVYHPNLSDDATLQWVTPDSGTWTECWCDGTNWFVNGTVVSATDTGVAFS